MNNLEFDRQHIWHPYTSALDPLSCYEVTGASGAELCLSSKEVLVDGMSSWWAAIHGYNHPVINQAAHAQVDKFAHVMFDGITHQPAIDLCKTLLNIVPEGLSRIFLADSGSVSIEIAIKMAIQYWASQGHTEKSRLLTPRGGYHGDTFAAMSVSDPVNGMHSLFSKTLIEHFFAPAPQIGFYNAWHPDEIAPMRDILEQHHHQIAALILEPIVQGAGAMRLYHPEYLKQCRLLCDEFDVLLICDEIATGFGRTGELFACNHAKISPDILCLGKALTGGYMSMAATICTEQVAVGVCEGEPGIFMHGPTFMANPLGCAVANASIELLLNSDWQSNIKRIETRLKHKLMPLANLDNVENVRCLGAIAVVQMKATVNVALFQKDCISQGAWIRPFGKLIYLIPPYICSDHQIDCLTQAIEYAITKGRAK